MMGGMSLALQLERTIGKPGFVVQPHNGGIRLVIQDLYAERHGKSVGWIIMKKARFDIDPDEPCRASILKLQKRVGKLALWRVLQSDLHSEWRNKGWGKKLYLQAFKETAPSIVVADSCIGGTTSPEAANVWHSLARSYPSEGTSVRSYAIAMKKGKRHKEWEVFTA